MWHAEGRIYFLSDRDGRANIYSMLPDGRGLQRHTKHEQYDIRWPALGGGVIVYQMGMDIWALDIARNETRKVDIQLPTDRLQARQKFVDPKQFITDFELSPDAKRLMFNARGELFTAPAKGKGLLRQLTFDSGVREKFPHWNPDGKEIFFWSDETGEEKLYRMPAEGGERTLIGTDNRGWHYPALPSPDGKRVAFSNEELELVVMEVSTGENQVVAQGGWEITNYNWSPDSRFLAFARPDTNYNSSIHIWDGKENRLYSVTDDYYNNYSPVFSPDGKYLFFISDRISNPHLDWRETIYMLDKRALPFVALLKKETLSPFAPLADPKAEKDEDNDKDKKDKDKGDKKKDKKDKKDEEKKEIEPVQIDFEGLSGRIIAAPVEPGNYFGLNAVEG
ncbi:MAG: hypothetical protein V2A61_00100, partial [Calditrichota bacterium]